MITGISIENFKGIGKRVDLEIRPITLLFGPNSAGKSTILHALQYAREIFERHNLDPDKTIGTGDFVDLGGFQKLVHGHNLEKSIRLRIRYQTDVQSLDEYDPYDGSVEYSALDDYLELDPLMTAFVNRLVCPSDPSLEIEISWSHIRKAPFVARLQLFDGKQLIASLESDSQGRRITLSVNEDYRAPSIVEWYSSHMREALKEELNDDNSLPEDVMEALSYNSRDTERPIIHVLLEAYREFVETDSEGNLFVGGLTDAFLLGEHEFKFELQADYHDESSNQMLDEKHDSLLGEIDWYSFHNNMTHALTNLLLSPIRRIADELSKMRYLGPIRELPERQFQSPRFLDPSRWASGLGAWDDLSAGDDQLLDATNEWLSDNRLGAGYEIRVKHFKKLDMSDPLMIKLITGRAFQEVDEDEKLNLEDIPSESEIIINPIDSDLELKPNDLGIGISQVVPVLVTALANEERLLCIEQPELHLHPKLQAELGDLFIHAALGDNDHRFMLETHSEHLILRILRRIRETTDGENPEHIPEINPNHVSVLYVESRDGEVVLHNLRIDETGEFIDRWPKGFFEERAKELF